MVFGQAHSSVHLWHPTYGLRLRASGLTELLAYTDMDWVGYPNTRSSTSGYCVFFGDSLVSWSSKWQPTVSRSSVEAEYRVVANVVPETCWLRHLLGELWIPLPKATVVFCDNVSATYLTANPIQHSALNTLCLMLSLSARRFRWVSFEFFMYRLPNSFPTS